MYIIYRIRNNINTKHHTYFAYQATVAAQKYNIYKYVKVLRFTSTTKDSEEPWVPWPGEKININNVSHIYNIAT